MSTKQPLDVVDVFIKTSYVSANCVAIKVRKHGLNVRSLVANIEHLIKDYKGLNSMVKISIYGPNNYTLALHLPTTTLVRHKIKTEGTGNSRTKFDLSLGAVLDVAREIKARSLSKTLSSCVKEVLGTCNSIGCSVNGEDPKTLQEDINLGNIYIPVE